MTESTRGFAALFPTHRRDELSEVDRHRLHLHRALLGRDHVHARSTAEQRVPRIRVIMTDLDVETERKHTQSRLTFGRIHRTLFISSVFFISLSLDKCEKNVYIDARCVLE